MLVAAVQHLDAELPGRHLGRQPLRLDEASAIGTQRADDQLHGELMGNGVAAPGLGQLAVGAQIAHGYHARRPAGARRSVRPV